MREFSPAVPLLTDRGRCVSTLQDEVDEECVFFCLGGAGGREAGDRDAPQKVTFFGGRSFRGLSMNPDGGWGRGRAGMEVWHGASEWGFEHQPAARGRNLTER